MGESQYPPSADGILSKNSVHLWLASLDQPPPALYALKRTLSADEETRTGRFHFQQDRDHFAVSRGLLRTILGYYLKISPCELQFYYEHAGKPALSPEISGGKLQFNLSHSHGFCLYAVAWERRVGVDLEFIRVLPDLDQVAKCCLSPRENVVLFSVPPPQRHDLFLTLWARKEAYLKAIGGGLSVPLNEIATLLPSGEPLVISSVEKGSRERTDWCIEDVKLAQPYVAAIAVEGQGWFLKYRNCPKLSPIESGPSLVNNVSLLSVMIPYPPFHGEAKDKESQ